MLKFEVFYFLWNLVLLFVFFKRINNNIMYKKSSIFKTICNRPRICTVFEVKYFKIVMEILQKHLSIVN